MGLHGKLEAGTVHVLLLTKHTVSLCMLYSCSCGTDGPLDDVDRLHVEINIVVGVNFLSI